MSLKDQAGIVKDALSADEKVLESAFKLEKLYKKYKFAIWSILALVILYFVGSAAYNWYQNNKMLKANQAFMTLEQNPKDSSALAELKANNPKLYELFRFDQAIKDKNLDELNKLGTNSDQLISDLSKYHAGVLNSKPVDSQYYHDMSLLEEAYTALKNKKIDLAKEKLSLISENSPLSGVARLLKHYTLTAK